MTQFSEVAVKSINSGPTYFYDTLEQYVSILKGKPGYEYLNAFIQGFVKFL